MNITVDVQKTGMKKVSDNEILTYFIWIYEKLFLSLEKIYIMKTGIYKIQSTCMPERCYIGSSVNITYRWRGHLSDLNLNHHHSPMLQRHYNKYGKEDLEFSILEECSKELLIKREQHYIDTIPHYFNCSPTAGNCKGIKRPEEFKAKLRGNQNAKGHTISEEVLNKSFRIPMSEEHKQACRHKHTPMSEETLQKPNYFQKGMTPHNKGVCKPKPEKILKGRKGININNTNASGKRSLEFKEACKQHKMPNNKGRKLDRATNTYYIP